MMVPLLVALTMVGASAPEAPQCAPNTRISSAIAALGQPGSRADDQLSVLASEPAAAACQLLRSLHVVHDTHVVGYQQEKHPETMRVIWALRALRYLTHCQEFRAATAEDPAKWDEVRRDWLLRDERGASVSQWKPTDRMRFFATWMSRDSVFIAPPDAQTVIIAQWRQWYRDKGSAYRFQPCESADDWYF